MTLEILREGIIIFERIKLSNAPDFSDKKTEDTWFTLLKNIPDQDFKKAINKLARTCKFFPTPAEIIEAVISEGANQAWDEVQNEIYRCCGLPDILPKFSSKIINCVVDSMGGIECIWDDLRERYFIRREFIELYNHYAQAEKKELPAEETKQLNDKK